MKPKNGLIDFSVGVFGGLLFLVVLFALMGAVISFTAGAQEKDPSYPQTRQWQLGQIYSKGGTYSNGSVIVFDTAGVCVYVVTGTLERAGSGGSDGQVHAIAAVPKTQLPKGAGCQ